MTVSTESPGELQHAVLHQAVTAARVAAALERMGDELQASKATIAALQAEREERDRKHADELRERDEQVSALQARNLNLETRLAELATIWQRRPAPMPQADAEGGTPE